MGKETFNQYLNTVFNDKDSFEPNRLVVKFGSSILTSQGNLRLDYLDSIAYQVSLAKKHGFQIAIVTSGAVACGKARLGIEASSLVDKQMLAAAGSTPLFSAWAEAFKHHGLVSLGHVLSEQDVQIISTGEPKWPLLDELHNRRVVPIINANDSVNISKLDVTKLEQLSVSADNDRLSAWVGRLVQAGGLILATEAPGIWGRDKQIIKLLSQEADFDQIQIEEKTDDGTGGVESKLEAAQAFARSGRSAWIVGGQIDKFR